MPRTRKPAIEAVPGELSVLKKIRARATRPLTPELRIGIGDDCALLNLPPGEELAVTTDLSIAGRHFRLDWHPAESVGHRVLARGLSDLAAMGARPVAAFLSLGLPADLVQKPKGREPRRKPPWIDKFLNGFLALARQWQTPLAGGDLAESPVAFADVVLAGGVPQGEALLRSGAHPGDQIYVTGALGGAAAGLARLTDLAAAFKHSRAKSRPTELPRIAPRLKTLLAPHLYPTPRIAEAQWIARNRLATAAIDLSDGLSTDLAHLCEESVVAAEIDLATLPIAPGATLHQALHGGEDYEILFTAAYSASVPAEIDGLPVTRIGRVVRPRPSASPVTLLTPEGPVPLAAQGWQHFA